VANRFDNVTRARFETTGAVHAAGATVESLNNSFINFQIADGSIVNNDVSATAAIEQSKLLMQLATTAASAPSGTQADKQAASGLASFDSSNFTITDGFVGIKNSGVSLAEIQNISANTFLGNLGTTPAAPSEVSTNTLVLAGINQLFLNVEDGATVLSRRQNALKITSTLTITGGVPIPGDGIVQAAVTTVTGNGYGAVVDVSYTDTPLILGGPTVPRYTGIAVVNGGNGYAEGDTLIVYGPQLGGVSPTNDIEFTVAATGSNIDTNVYVGIQKTSITADPNAIVKTDIDSNLGTAGTRFNTVYATLFDGNVKGNVTGNLTGNVTGTVAAAGQATNLAGGSIGSIPYQSDVNTTAFLEPGAIGRYLRSEGPGQAPIWEELSIPDGDANTLTGTTLASGVVNSSLTSVGVLTSLAVAGVITHSVEDNITASGTTPAGAYQLTKSINIITTSASPLPGNPAPGVIMPNGVPIGYRVIIRNNTFNNNVSVYPNDGAQINNLGTNAEFVLNGETALEFICTRNAIPGVQVGQWYTLNATFA
jgi:hypothetical protein